MRAALLLAALLALSSCSCLSFPPVPLPEAPAGDPGAGVEELLDATVGLVGELGEIYCSGARVSATEILTAAHCVRNVTAETQRVRVGLRAHWDPGGTQDRPRPWFTKTTLWKVAWRDLDADVALLRWTEMVPPPTLGPTLEFRESALFRGMQVVAAGHPVVAGYGISTGVVVDPQRTVREGRCDNPACGLDQRLDELFTVWFSREVMLLNLPAGRGYSGGPVVDRAGRLVGLMTDVYQGYPGHSSATPLAVLRAAAAH